MDYMLLIVNRKNAPAGESVGMAEMGKYAGELGQQGKLRGGAPLQPESAGARVTVRRGKSKVVDGPFAESKEVIGGWFMFEAASRAEAVEIAKRCPATRSGVVALHQAMRDSVDSAPSGTRHLLLFLEGPDFDGDPDGSKYREMEKWTDELKLEKKYVECAGLPKSPPGARIESRGGKLSVTDGPFAEAKEVVGGYALVVAPDRKAALEIAARCPHAAWGEVEVREVINVPGPGSN
jgi:hypothetical protein